MLESSSHPGAASASTAAVPRIHLASPADVPFIVEAIAAESRNGHFACDCSRPDVLRGLWHQVATLVSDGVAPMPGARNGAGGRAFVVQVQSANAGFALLVEAAPGSWPQRVELFALVTHPAWRGRGLARTLVLSLVATAQSQVVYARCAPRSGAMQAMLLACGFVRTDRTDDGVTTLEFRQPTAG